MTSLYGNVTYSTHSNSNRLIVDLGVQENEALEPYTYALKLDVTLMYTGRNMLRELIDNEFDSDVG